MVYLIVYAIFAYLFTLGIVLGEILNDVKPNWWQVIAIVFAPVMLPVVLGMHFVSLINK